MCKVSLLCATLMCREILLHYCRCHVSLSVFSPLLYFTWIADDKVYPDTRVIHCPCWPHFNVAGVEEGGQILAASYLMLSDVQRLE